MRSKRGSAIVAVLVIALIVLVGVIIYNYSSRQNYKSLDTRTGDREDQDSLIQPELTKTDEISDIEKDLNSTKIENLDSEVLGITSQVSD